MWFTMLGSRVSWDWNVVVGKGRYLMGLTWIGEHDDIIKWIKPASSDQVQNWTRKLSVIRQTQLQGTSLRVPPASFPFDMRWPRSVLLDKKLKEAGYCCGNNLWTFWLWHLLKRPTSKTLKLNCIHSIFFMILNPWLRDRCLLLLSSKPCSFI